MKRNLLAEMRRFGLTQSDLCAPLGISERAFQKKVSGESDFYFRDIETIRDKFFPQYRLDYLMYDDAAETKGA